MNASEELPVIQLFGPLVVADGARRLGPRGFGGVKPKQVFEILLAARGRLVPKDRIADMLWSHDLPQNIDGAVATYVSVIRRRLEAAGLRGRDLVVTETEAYRFAVDRAHVDLDRFDDLVGRAATVSTSEQRRLLDEALSLVHGDVLEDEPYAVWVEDLRGTYGAHVLGARLDAAEAALAERDHAAALRHAEAAIAIDRFSERAHRLAMLALYALGRQHEAINGYQKLRRLLDEDLGLEPMPETRALHTSVLRHEDVAALLPRPRNPTAGLARPAEPSLALLGRGDELAALEGTVRRTLEGAFSLALIEGEAGLGTTRLLDELSASPASTRVGRATCSQLERHLPYVPLAAAVRDARAGTSDTRALPALGQILPELGRSGSDCPHAEVDALEALIELVEAHAPLVLLLDDLQWADLATLGAIAYLQRRCAGLPLAIVGAARTEEVGPDHPIRRLKPTLHLRLEPLTSADLSPLGIPDLHARTGGNPRLVTAAVGQGSAVDLEHALAETVLARCRSEGVSAHALLVCASLLEEPFEPARIGGMTDLDPAHVVEQLEHLCDRKLLAVDGLGFRFRYMIFREALRGSVSPARRRILCQRARAAQPQRPWPGESAPTVPVSSGLGVGCFGS